MAVPPPGHAYRAIRGRRFARHGDPAHMGGNGAPYRQLRNRPPVNAGAAVYVSKSRNQVQEQIQIIATAIGKPAAKALTIVKVNAKSGFTSGRKLCTDIRLLHYARINRKVASGRMRCRFPLATRVQKGELRWCADMVNERLKRETYLE